MNIKIAYENLERNYEIESKEFEPMIAAMRAKGIIPDSFEVCDLQQIIDREFNRTEINNRRKYHRHAADLYKYISDSEYDSESDLMDKYCFVEDDTKAVEEEDLCREIRKNLKSSQAELIIAIIIKGYRIKDYAAKTGDNPNNVSHKYRRAMKKLQKHEEVFVRYSQI